jgi:hypothetical protein
MNEIIEIDRRMFAAKLKAAGNNLKKVSVPPALSNRRSAEEFIQLITGCRARAVENIVAIGQHLRDAKAELDHGEFGPMLERIKFSAGTARKYMAIAAHPVISNRSNWNALPPSWTTLYALSTFSPEVLEARIADGTITPDFEGTGAAALKGKPAGSRSSRRRDLTESHKAMVATKAASTQEESAARYGVGRPCELEERIAELEAEIEAERETARDRERELEHENIRLRSEVEALRARVAELEGGEASQSNGAPLVAPRVIELMTEEDRRLLERAGQQRLPFEWEIGTDATCAREAVA